MNKKIEKRLQASEQEEPAILAIVRQMMFVYGDDEKPLPSCETFVLDLVKHQVLLVANQAWEVAKQQKASEIRLKDLFYPMRNHPDFIIRLLKYAQAAQKIAEVTRDADETEENSAKTKKMEGAYTELIEALNPWKLDISSDNIDKYTDSYFEGRQKRMVDRVCKLQSKVYERFTEARKANFCGSSKKGTRRAKDPFITWLGNPPLAKFADFVLAFIARETVASITDDAASLRDLENENLKGYFIDEGLTACLQLRHYEQALRRNLYFRRTGNYLFGTML